MKLLMGLNMGSMKTAFYAHWGNESFNMLCAILGEKFHFHSNRLF